VAELLRLIAAFVEFVTATRGELLGAIRAHEAEVTVLLVLTDGALAGASVDGTVAVWRGGWCDALLRGHAGAAVTLHTLPDGGVAGGHGGAAVAWRRGPCDSGQGRWPSRGHAHPRQLTKSQKSFPRVSCWVAMAAATCGLAGPTFFYGARRT
jgi:hypothetical protein